MTRPADADAPAFIKEYVDWGAGPRASQYLVLGAKARAAMAGRPMADLDDVRSGGARRCCGTGWSPTSPPRRRTGPARTWCGSWSAGRAGWGKASRTLKAKGEEEVTLRLPLSTLQPAVTPPGRSGPADPRRSRIRRGTPDRSSWSACSSSSRERLAVRAGDHRLGALGHGDGREQIAVHLDVVGARHRRPSCRRSSPCRAGRAAPGSSVTALVLDVPRLPRGPSGSCRGSAR